MKLRSIPVFFVVALCACRPSTPPSNESVTPPPTPLLPELEAGLTAHGGFDKWRGFGTLQYTLASGVPEVYTVDLVNRKTVIKTDTAYTIGYDGTNVWVSPSLKAYSGNSARFYYNLVFYFFAQPFVLADAGATHTALPDAVLDSVEYRRVKVVFSNTVGASPNDQFVLWFRKSDNRLGLLNYSMTYFNAADAESYNAVVFDEWQEANGLTVPKQWSFYAWAGDTLGVHKGSMKIENVSFKAERPDSTLFMKPEMAEIEPVGSM